MAEAMHMVQLRFDPRAFVRLAARAGDVGYGAHQVLLALFGSRAPQPFRLLRDRDRTTILGYAAEPLEALQAYAACAAEPAHLSAVRWADSASKPMPTNWQIGMRFQYEVQVCPIKRTRTPKPREVDVWLDHARSLDKDVPAPSRQDIYTGWLNAQIARQGGAEIESVRMTRFERVRLARKHHAKGSRARMERPLAVLVGTLRVSDPVAFMALLRRGIGRHRAFGFGMLMLRPC